MHPSDDDLLGSDEAARIIGVSRTTLRRLVDSRDIEPARTAPGGPHGSRLFKRSDVERIKSHRRAG